jgi:acetyl-CoA C-acetyltransferase
MGTTVIVDACRTPRGSARKPLQGELSGVHPQELAATCLRAIDARNPNFDPETVDDVYLGAVLMRRAVEIDGRLKYGGGENDQCVARWAVLQAGWPDHIPGVSVNRFCGSGLQAIMFGHGMVASGQEDVVVAGGVESMSRNPMMLMTDDDPDMFNTLCGFNHDIVEKIHPVPQGISADLIATREGFSREELDAFALNSQRKAAHAIQAGHFSKGIVPVVDKEGKVILDHDENPRPETTAEKLAELKPAFEQMGAMLDQFALNRYPDVERIQHLHTAGNSSGICDGAAVALLMDEAVAKDRGVSSRAKIVSSAARGDEPLIMLTAPAIAAQHALDRAGMKASDIDLWEINEAFATVPMQTIRRLAIDPAKVNVDGGAIALGHPLGATGAMLLGTALDALEREDKETALITLCTGGGMAVATIISRA